MVLTDLAKLIRARREALGLSQARLAQLSGLSRQTLVGLEAGALGDLGYNRVGQVLAVLGLAMDAPNTAARRRQRGLWMAARTASVSHAAELAPEVLGEVLVGGEVPGGFAGHLTHLLDEAPVPLVVMAVEEAAERGGVPPRQVWRRLRVLARDLGVHRQALWT